MEISDQLFEAVNGGMEAVEGRRTLACATGFKIAEKYQVPLGTIGRICNDNSIKIKSCQLGCFK